MGKKRSTDPGGEHVPTADASAFRAAVRDVMVGGEYVLHDGVLAGIEWPRIVTRARDAADRLRHANAETRQAVERLAPVVSQFCVALGRCAHDLPRKLPA